jgi:2-iminobutanoate/2-iminopropanoate deaminase
MIMKIITSSAAPAAIGPYSQAIAAGGFLFLSGQIPLDPHTMELVEGDTCVQTQRVVQNIAAVLSEAGIDKNRVVKCSVFLKDLNDFAAMNEVYTQFFGDHKPARSTFQVAALPKGAQVEIECVAQLP